MGGDPADLEGIDLVKGGVYGRDENNSVGKQGLNGWIFALLTLDTMGYKTTEGAEFDRERILDEIVSSQNTDGGFSLSKGESDIDITAMALQRSPHITTIFPVTMLEKALAKRWSI